MTEKEKMLAGKLYDPSDEELATLRTKAHNLSQDYNKTYETEEDKRKEILDELVPNRKGGVYLQGPIQFDYGVFTTIGENTYANFNLTVLDCAPVSIGDNVFFGPNVSILTPVHPICYKERNMYRKENGQMTDREYAKPITIADVHNSGCIRELCGRIENLFPLYPISPDTFRNMLNDRKAGPRYELESEFGIKFRITDAAKDEICHEAISSKLGVRYIKKTLRSYVDNAMWDKDDPKVIEIG